MIKLIIFDLDGTLLNTIADLADSTNHALRLCGFPERETEEYKMFVGNGINKLFERALPEGNKTPENILRVRSAFLEYYDSHNADRSVPFPGIVGLLERLRDCGYTLAVASNKYHSATRKLVAHFFPEIEFVSVLGQREGIPAKPDPTVVYEIIRTSGVTAGEVLYVGDSGVDMQTAKNAGVTAVGVTWGFRSRDELQEFSPDYIVSDPAEIPAIVEK